MSRITKGAAGAALCGSTGASMGGAVVGGITLLAVLSLVLPVLSSARPSVPVLVLLLAVLSALLPVSAVASFPSSHGFFILNIRLSSLMRRHTFLQQDLSVP